VSYRDSWADAAEAQWKRLQPSQQKAVSDAVHGFVSAGRGCVERLGGPRLRLRIAGIDILMHDDPENGIITVIGVYRR
jgi:mRNA-degrading endonuclease RelE of RelBE toxin-antitoxin system